MTDIWSNEEVIPAETPDAEDTNSGGVVLDLSGEDFSGDTYETIPVGTLVRVTVYDGEQRFSKAGNNMYALKLRVVGDEWGKNRTLNSWLVLATKALFFTLPQFAALGKPATYNGEPVKTKNALALAHKADGGKGEFLFPQLEDVLGAEVFAKVVEHTPGAPDDDGKITKYFEKIELKSLDTPQPKAPVKDNPYKS